MNIDSISVLGMGKLGAVVAAVMADRKFQVTGVDPSPECVAAINRGQAPVREPGLDEMIARNRERLRASTDAAAAVAASDATFLIVPTPSEDDGRFTLRYVLQAAQSAGAALRHKRGYHLVVLASTVMPGSTGGVVRQRLEEASGKKSGPDFGLCYSPEFIALGSVIHDMTNPDLILIGESDPRAGDVLESIQRRLVDNRPQVRRMNFVNAELTKLAVNTFVTTKISYANMLAEICDRLEDADVDVVTEALGLDSRIGGKYLKGALGYGGPCFPRDNRAFARLGESLGADATLARATDEINRRQTARLGALVETLLPEGGTAGVLGLAYKPLTDVVEESPGIQLALELARRGIAVVAWDSLAMDNARQILDGSVRLAGSMAECAAASSVLALMTAASEFKSLKPEHLAGGGARAIIDCWRVLDRTAFEPFADYVTLGRGRSSSALAAVR